MSDREQETSSLHESVRSLLSDAFEDAPFEFWARDLTGRCIVANAETRALGAILGRKVEDANVPPDLIAAWQDNNRRAFAGECVQNEFEYGEGERKRFLQCYIVPLRITGEIKGILGFNIDVTGRKRTEQALREVDRRRSEFLGILSHELRNPLAVIATGLRCIDREALVDDQTRRAIEAIERQSRHLGRLVDDLLDITRVRSGKINLQYTSVDLVQLVRSTIEDHRELLAGHVVTTRAPDAPVWLQGDPTRLGQIVDNLLSNAVKFTPSGGAISVALAVAGERVVLEVSDTGVGIDDDSFRQLFVPFAQADRSLDRSRAGLGLGLALVKMLVEMHGGNVRAHSAGPGQGATFTISLPLGEPASRGSHRTRKPSPVRRRILVIEDDVDVAEWLAHALSFSGHEVTVVLGGEEGLARARQLEPDVILCDIGLPGALDGYGVARALTRDASLATIYRVALSGFAQPEDQRRAREAGFHAHLAKPPDLDALEQLLAELPLHSAC